MAVAGRDATPMASFDLIFIDGLEPQAVFVFCTTARFLRPIQDAPGRACISGSLLDPITYRPNRNPKLLG
jgi:hypothetical protein